MTTYPKVDVTLFFFGFAPVRRYVCMLFQDYLTKRVVSCHAVVGVEDRVNFALFPLVYYPRICHCFSQE